MVSRVVLKASNVAAMVGRHRYKPRVEVLDELVKKYAPDKFTGKTKEDKATEALAVSSTAQEVLESALNIKAENSTQVQRVFSEAKERINFDSKLKIIWS